MPPIEHPFDALVLHDWSEIRLAEAALLFARDRYPDLAPQHYLAHLDGLAQAVARSDATEPLDRIDALRAILVAREGLVGNADHYYDPRNSYLNEVLERRTGIPISLSVVWLDVAERLDWPLVGIGLPGHFILRYGTADAEILIDPFRGGAQLTRAECSEIVSAVYHQPVALTDEHFVAATKREMIARMLNNLRSIYADRHEWHHAVNVIWRMIAIDPENPELHEYLHDASAHLARTN